MEAIPAMPVNTPAVNDAATSARDPKGGESADARGFGDALKQEIAARSGDGKDAKDPKDAAADKKASGPSDAEDATEDTATADDAPATIDPAVAALLADGAAQPALPDPRAIAVQPPVQQAAVAAADAPGAAAETDVTAIGEAQGPAVRRSPGEGPAEKRTGERGAGRARERAGVERVPAERSARAPEANANAAQRAAAERAAGEPGAAERLPGARGVAERTPAELREAHAARESGERVPASDKSGADAPAAAFLNGFTVDRTASAADAPLPVAAAASTLDSLSAATLAARWAAPAAGAPADAAQAPVTARVDTPLGAPGWNDAFQQKVVWMVDRHLERAELHINPPHLGPVDVMLSMSADGAQIAFASPHAAVRDAIEQSLPDLANALDQRGLSLGQATVGADSGAAREQFAEQAREAAKHAQNGRGGHAGGALSVEAPTPARAAIVRRGLVDTFA